MLGGIHMYKSAIGIFVSNLLMIWIVLLNNEGPGWEVPVSTMQNIAYASLLLSISFIFVFATLFISLKKFKNKTFLFKISYFTSLVFSSAFLIFLFCVQGFQGQFWVSNFPTLIFIAFSLGINLILLIIISISRFKTSMPKN
jgi:hypothetical protein